MLRSLADLLVPRSCWSCGAGASGALCATCTADLPWLGRGRRTVAAGPLIEVWTPLAFDGPARDLVHALKFRAARGVAGAMARQIADAIPPSAFPPDAVLVPAPAHRGRTRARAFDHAAELALALGPLVGLPVASPLRRDPAAGQHQLGRSRRDRLALVAAPPHIRARVPSSCVLVDDVHTTGATLLACAVALRAAGAGRVAAVAYARAV